MSWSFRISLKAAASLRLVHAVNQYTWDGLTTHPAARKPSTVTLSRSMGVRWARPAWNAWR